MSCASPKFYPGTKPGRMREIEQREVALLWVKNSNDGKGMNNEAGLCLATNSVRTCKGGV